MWLRHWWENPSTSLYRALLYLNANCERSVGKIVARSGEAAPTNPVRAKYVEPRHRSLLRYGYEPGSRIPTCGENDSPAAAKGVSARRRRWDGYSLIGAERFVIAPQQSLIDLLEQNNGQPRKQRGRKELL